jgi:hypothetical protein
MSNPLTFRLFKTAQQARDYRHNNGTGGWIFVNGKTETAMLYPPHMTPIEIFHHDTTRHQSGALIGNG